jgi:hypothetical protein
MLHLIVALAIHSPHALPQIAITAIYKSKMQTLGDVPSTTRACLSREVCAVLPQTWPGAVTLVSGTRHRGHTYRGRGAPGARRDCSMRESEPQLSLSP